MADKLAIYMISYHRPNDFRFSLESVLSHTNVPYHLYIIDNSSGSNHNHLLPFYDHPNITIFENNINMGKGPGLMKYYPETILNHNLPYFISIDADVQVLPNWDVKLLASRNKIDNFAMLAPVIMNRPDDYFVKQLRSGLIMHGSEIYHVSEEIYYNRNLAGPLLLIDKSFFEKVGGYSTAHLYGGDDGKLCGDAFRLNKFVGLAANNHVIHLRSDENKEYQKWKKENINKGLNIRGYWD